MVRIYNKKYEGLFSNKLATKFLNLLTLKQSKNVTEKLFYRLSYILNHLKKIQPMQQIYNLTHYNLTTNKLFDKKIRNSLKKIPLICSLLSNLKESIKSIISIFRNNTLYNSFSLNCLVSFSQSINLLDKKVINKNHLVILNKKYLHFRW